MSVGVCLTPTEETFGQRLSENGALGLFWMPEGSGSLEYRVGSDLAPDDV
jgi:hypothetical protein